jgi:hypothetical protein
VEEGCTEGGRSVDAGRVPVLSRQPLR